MEHQLKIDAEKAIYAARFAKTAWHSHGAPVLYVALDNAITVEFKSGGSIQFQAAFVNGDVVHKTDLHGGRAVLVYFFAHTYKSLQLTRFYLQGRDYRLITADIDVDTGIDVDKDDDKENPAIFAPINIDAENDVINLTEQWLCDWPLLQSANLDPRIANSIRRIIEAEELPTRSELAQHAGLSESYFNHLFSDSLGVSFRSYKQWVQLFRCAQGYRARQSLTDAAMYGGFVDSSHFSKTFKKVFGLSPSTVFNQLQQLWIEDAVMAPGL